MKKTNHTRALLLLAGLSTLAGCFDGDADAPGTERGASDLNSLTGKTFTGKKYYLGWGHAGQSDPQDMHNEVRYDVLHTHQIFTAELGGTYQGSKLVDGVGSTQEVVQGFEQLRGQMTASDMFIQYSSGHGFPEGLQIGGTHEEHSTRLLTLPAKEIIVFTMACYSGGLVDALNAKRAQWQNFAAQGRTLFVMSSSTVQQTSSTGPGADGLGGPTGSAGSAYGHSLWKALVGDADGYVDGVKDGFIDLGEIEAYVKASTKQLGGHDPQVTGSYNPMLIMNRVPQAKDNLTYADRGTSGYSPEQMQAEMQRTDDQWMNQQISPMN